MAPRISLEAYRGGRWARVGYFPTERAAKDAQFRERNVAGTSAFRILNPDSQGQGGRLGSAGAGEIVAPRRGNVTYLRSLSGTPRTT